jgi:putative salt-induced outer membrane protein
MSAVRSSELAASAFVLVAAAVALRAQTPAAKTSFTGDVGIISASGNTQLRTLSVGDKIAHTNGRWILSQLGAYIYGETGDVSSANQLRLAARSDYLFHPRVSVFTSAAFERNTFAGFDRRTDENLGLSWKALMATWDSLNVDLGGVMTQQSNVDGTSRSFPAGRLAGAYKHAFSKASYFQQLAEYMPDLESTGEYRVNSESSIVAPLSSHAGVKVGYVVRYNSLPPLGFGSTDRVLTSGIQVSF